MSPRECDARPGAGPGGRWNREMMRVVRTAPTLAVAMFLATVIATPESSGLGWQLAARTTVGTTTPLLFEAEPSPNLAVPRGARVRRRTARVNQTLLNGIAGLAPAAPVMTLNLFPNVVYTAVLDAVEDTNPGRAWTGHLEGEPLGTVVLAVFDGAFAGHVSVPGALYEIAGGPDDTAVIAEVDPSLLPPKGPPLVAPAGAALWATAVEAGATATTTIDVAIFYTVRARKRAGGVAKIKAAIAAAVAQANQVYEKSGVKLRIRTAVVGQIKYRESGDMGLDLARLQRTNDRMMDVAHRRRDGATADLVHLIVAPNKVYCGLAYLLAGNTPSFGFGATAVDCLTNFTLVHELGHNMGAHHDWYVDNDAGAFPYSHGYVDVKRRFLTVMAYFDACTARRVVCSTVAFFSNPNKRFQRGALGVRRDARTNCRTGIVNPKCAADNRATLNRTRMTIASFR